MADDPEARQIEVTAGTKTEVQPTQGQEGYMTEVEALVNAAAAPINARIENLKRLAPFPGQDEAIANLEASLQVRIDQTRAQYEQEHQAIEAVRGIALGAAVNFLIHAGEENYKFQPMLVGEEKDGLMLVRGRGGDVLITPNMFQSIGDELFALAGARASDANFLQESPTVSIAEVEGEGTGIFVVDRHYAVRDNSSKIAKQEISFAVYSQLAKPAPG